MQKKSVAALTAAMLMAVPVCSFAAAWYVPSNVRVVQKSNTDTTGRVYSTIQAAINNITNASATNPYVVKVMPGEYDLGNGSTNPIVLKPYVTLEGSGAENTIIKATSSDTEGCHSDPPNQVGTIRMAHNSAVKNLTIQTTSTIGHVTGISVINVKGAVDGVTIIGNGVTGTDGICMTGPEFAPTLTEIDINNSTIESTSTSGQANAIKSDYGHPKLTATHSKFVSVNNGDSGGDVINVETAGASMIITDSIFETKGTNNPTNHYVLNPNNGTMKVTNSKIIGSCKINGTWEIPNSLQIINTMIENGNSSCYGWDNPSVRLVNNYDQNGNLIPNQ